MTRTSDVGQLRRHTVVGLHPPSSQPAVAMGFSISTQLSRQSLITRARPGSYTTAAPAAAAVGASKVNRSARPQRSRRSSRRVTPPSGSRAPATAPGRVQPARERTATQRHRAARCTTSRRTAAPRRDCVRLCCVGAGALLAARCCRCGAENVRALPWRTQQARAYTRAVRTATAPLRCTCMHIAVCGSHSISASRGVPRGRAAR